MRYEAVLALALLAHLLPRLVPEHRPEPPLDLRDAHPLPLGIILDLVSADGGDGEVARLAVREIQTADGGGWGHGVALGERDAGRLLGVEELEDCRLLGVVGLRGIAGRGADTLVVLGDEIL